MSGECQVFAAGLSFPDVYATAAVSGSEQNTIGAEFKRVHPVGVLAAFVGQFACGCAVDADDFLGAGESDHGLVGTDVGGKDFVEFVTDGHESFAGADVPHHAETFGSTATTTGEQQAAVAAELQDTGTTFGERKHAESFEGAGVVQDHLFLTGHGHQFRPRVCGDG